MVFFLLLSFCIFYTSNSNGTYTPFKAHINFNCLLFHAVYLILFFVRFNCGFFYLAQSLSFFFSSLVRRNWLAFHLMHHLIRAYKFNVHNKPTIQWLYQCFVRNFIYLIKRAMYTFRFLGNQVKFESQFVCYCVFCFFLSGFWLRLYIKLWATSVALGHRSIFRPHWMLDVMINKMINKLF